MIAIGHLLRAGELRGSRQAVAQAVADLLTNDTLLLSCEIGVGGGHLVAQLEDVFEHLLLSKVGDRRHAHDSNTLHAQLFLLLPLRASAVVLTAS